ncbi:uncharacterized protein ACRADG_003612 isoform 2-T2 [Cochliomyia hominivorax]
MDNLVTTETKESNVTATKAKTKDLTKIINKPKRYKLQRSTENFDDHCEHLLSSKRTDLTDHSQSVMGGGFATPPPTYCKQFMQNAVPTSAALLTNLSNETLKTNSNSNSNSTITNTTTSSTTLKHIQSAIDLPMHEKLLENDGCEKSTTSSPKDKTEKLKTKTHKESKFAEKLRRSFRRAEHKSLEIKRQDKKDTGDLTAAQERSSSLRPLQQQLQNSASIFSLTNLPGLGGHINPALLLDSPDESTPPEFAYRHLSSVATTNSSTSLESNFCESPTTSISYWAWHMNNNNMGGELSTSAANNSNNTKQSNQNRGNASTDNRKRLEQQSSSKSDYEQPAVTTASRSCSTASESSTAAKLTRLQNFLFKSSNESSRSIQGHSNEGFTASSFNSSSGEWENLCNFPSTSNNPPASEDISQLSIDTEPLPSSSSAPPVTSENNGSMRNYYQYTLASPNNPFLPEITARTYHSTYEEEEEDRELEDELDSNVTSVKYRIGCHSAQLPTPIYSRTGSQESTHSDYGGGHNLEPQSWGSSANFTTPGKHKRKLFSLSTPTKLNFPQSTSHHYHPAPAKSTDAPGSNSSASFASTQHKNVTKTSSCNLVRSLNPFLPSTTVTSSSPPQRTASSTSLNKRTGPLKQQAVTSPIAVNTTNPLKDLNARREEFLRATMQICLVVSPPSSRLQLKSKSLTHLDGLESELVCNPAKNSNNSEASSSHVDTSQVSSFTTTTTVAAAAAAASSSSGSQHTLKPLPLPSVNDNNSGASNSTLSYSLGGDLPVGGSITPTSYKKKSSFLQRKKPILTRSEVSSSEYFSVSFCNEAGCQDEEFFPATKGVTLANALSQSLRRRNLSFTQLTITDSNDNNQTPAFLEAGSSPLQTSLDENTDVENLAGHHLIIMDKDSSRKTLQKAASFGSRNRPPRLLSSASTDESTEVNLTGKQLKQRWSGLFGVKNPQQSQLCELLNNYSKNGVPQKTPATLRFDHPELINAIEYLDNRHKSWMDIVESGGMNDSEMRIQTAIWELVTTEVDYIHCLQTVTDLFLACLEAVQEEGLLKEVDQHRLFANIRDICEANLKFWTFYLYPMVAHSINTREPLKIMFFQQGFIAFGNIFAPYKKYCAEQSTCQFYCKELNRTNSLFTSYLAWCEAQKMCNRLRLADILVRPMQRLTKYSLLLAAIKKHMTDVEEIEAIETMLHTTENFVFSVNNHLTTRQENERLKGVMARIESYDVVDTNNEHLEKMIKQYSQMFDLCGPMKGCASQHVRHLFMEGDHKYKDNLGKVEVHCFLLTDMLLVCKSIAKKGLGTLKVIRQPYLTDRLIVQHSNNLLSCVYLNEFQVAISAFTLQCTEAKNWYEALKRAKMIYTRLKQSSLMNPWDSIRYTGSTADSLGVKKSPMNSSICSHVTSANNSHSGSVEWNDSRNISVDFDKTNSLSSDEGCTFLGAHGFPLKGKPLTTISPQKIKVNTTSSANMLTVQPLNHLGQSLPNLNLHHSHTNNTLLVPGTANSAHSGNLLLSPSHRGISYPPPSPTRVPLRRGMAFSNSIKNPPLLKTRNITSQNSINWQQIPATPTPTSPQSQQLTSGNKPTTTPIATSAPVNTIEEQQEQITQSPPPPATTATAAAVAAPQESAALESATDCSGLQLTNSVVLSTQLSNSTETDV